MCSITFSDTDRNESGFPKYLRKLKLIDKNECTMDQKLADAAAYLHSRRFVFTLQVTVEHFGS